MRPLWRTQRSWQVCSALSSIQFLTVEGVNVGIYRGVGADATNSVNTEDIADADDLTIAVKDDVFAAVPVQTGGVKNDVLAPAPALVTVVEDDVSAAVPVQTGGAPAPAPNHHYSIKPHPFRQ